MKNKKDLQFIFFGTDNFSTIVLDQLKSAGFLPKIIVTAPDRPSGRGQKIQKSAVKIWTEQNNADAIGNSITILQPEKLDEVFVAQLKGFRIDGNTSENDWDFFVVASYGKIIPQSVLNIPKFGALNVHPSLLPLYRGASPIESAILDDARETGVTIMLMDAKMDHGPILNQEIVYFEDWPKKIEVEKQIAEIGGKILAETIEPFIIGEIIPQDQDDRIATFTEKISKEMGKINFDDIKDVKSAREIFLKIQALNPWPGVYFFIKHGDGEIRVKITEAKFVNSNDDENDSTDKGTLEILKVVPEGRKEMTFSDFEKGFLQN